MKIRNSSRIVAIVLALMMIVPLISVPAFATTAKVDGTTANGEKVTPIASNDFEDYEAGATATGNGLASAPTNAVIADLDGNKVVKYDVKPVTTNKDGVYFINPDKDRNTFYVATMTNARMDPNTQKILYTGTVSISGSVYYFKDAELNTDQPATECKLYSNETYETEYTAKKWYFCTAQVRNAWQGQTNVATPSWLAGTLAGTSGKVFVVQADYRIDSNMLKQAIDVRMDNENGKNIEIATLEVTADGGVKVRLHNDMSVKDYNPGYIVERDTWFTLTAVLKGNINNGYSTTLYVDGNLVAYGESTKTGTFNGTKNGFNLGHTNRGSAVSTYSGNYYVDNVAVYDTTDVLPESWQTFGDSFSEDLESGKFPASLAWTGSVKNVVQKDGNWCLELPADAPNDGNVDKRVHVNGFAADSGIIRIDTDYYLPSNAQYGFQGQLTWATADCSSTPGGAADKATDKAYQWVDLYFIRVRDGIATLHSVGSGNASKPTYLMKGLPTDEFFTLSTLIDLKTGEAAVLVNGQMAAHFWMYRTDGFLTNMSFGFGQLLVGKINSYKTSGMTDVGYKGSLFVDNVKAYQVDELPEIEVPSVSYDFENTTAGTKPVAPDSSYGFTTSATYGYLDTLDTKFVEISMLGDVDTVERLDTPFFVTNLRSYDLTVTVDSFDPTQEITLDLLNSLTKTNATDNSKPVYYAYVASENTVYVYNNGGNAATADNIANFKLETYTIGEANYNSMYRIICGGKDTNIDKSFRVAHPGLALPGTYVLSADYFVANDASGEVTSQSYNASQKKWLDFYTIDLATKQFKALGAITAGKGGQDLLVDEWNTVTLIVTVGDDLLPTIDFYLNGVYTFTKEFGYSFEANSWSIAKPAKPSNLDKAQSLSGYIRVDNVKVNAVAYDENDIQTIDASNVLGFDIEFADGKFLSLTNVSDSTELKIYGATYVNAMTTDFLNMRVGNIVTTTDKASIRLKGDEIGTGLRFATEINASTLAFLDQMIAAGQIKSYNYGTLIAPTDYLSDDIDLSFENFVEDETMLDVEANLGMYFNMDDDVYTEHFAGSITNIFESNYNRAFSGRGYFQVTLKNGQVVTYYSDYTHSVSVAEQALTTINAGVYEVGSDAYNILAGFAGLQ